MLLLMVGCTADPADETGLEIVLASEDLRLQTVFPDGRLLFDISSEDNRWDNYEPEYALLSSGTLTPLTLPIDPACLTGARYLRPSSLPDGRLGFIKQCRKSLEGLPTDRGEFLLVAFDLQTGDMEQIVAKPLYIQASIVNYSWNPAMTQGVASTGDLMGTFYWIFPDGPKPIDMTIGDGAQAWVLSDAITELYDPDLAYDDWPRVGRASRPTWSPDGKRIAFFASPSAMRLDGLARAGVPFNLYLMTPTDFEPRVVLERIFYEFALEWSPDGESLLIDGCMGPLRRCGLWTYSVTSGKSNLIVTGDKFFGSDWLSNTKIITSRCRDPEELICSSYALMQYDLSEID